MGKPRFPLGQLVSTPGALEAMRDAGVSPSSLLRRHQSGDWGRVPPEDARENEISVAQGYRILSSYTVGEKTVWVLTEADRSVTTLLLDVEY